MSDSHRSCSRCTAKTIAGRQCSFNSCKTGPYCWMHTKSIQHVRIKTSTISGAGNGAFAAKKTKDSKDLVFKEGDKIADYTGRLLDRNQLNKEEKEGRQHAYVMEITKDRLIDASASNAGISRYINHKHHGNVEFQPTKLHRGKRTGVKIVAKKNIKDGQELFADYGPSYFINR